MADHIAHREEEPFRAIADGFTHNDPAKFGGESADWLLRQIRQFYTEQEEHALGVLGIEFEVVR